MKGGEKSENITSINELHNKKLLGKLKLKQCRMLA